MEKEKINSDEYFKLVIERSKAEETEDDLKSLKKYIHTLKDDTNIFWRSIIQIKDKENDISSSDYANKVGIINDELLKNVKKIQYQVEEYEDEIKKDLKKNAKNQKLIQEKITKLKKDVKEND